MLSKNKFWKTIGSYLLAIVFREVEKQSRWQSWRKNWWRLLFLHFLDPPGLSISLLTVLAVAFFFWITNLMFRFFASTLRYGTYWLGFSRRLCWLFLLLSLFLCSFRILLHLVRVPSFLLSSFYPDNFSRFCFRCYSSNIIVMIYFWFFFGSSFLLSLSSLSLFLWKR